MKYTKTGKFHSNSRTFLQNPQIEVGYGSELFDFEKFDWSKPSTTQLMSRHRLWIGSSLRPKLGITKKHSENGVVTRCGGKKAQHLEMLEMQNGNEHWNYLLFSIAIMFPTKFMKIICFSSEKIDRIIDKNCFLWI